MNEIKVSLRAARLMAGHSRLDAGKLLGIHRETLGHYERDSTNIPRSVMMKLESAYGIPIDNFYFGKEDDLARILNEKKLITC